MRILFQSKNFKAVTRGVIVHMFAGRKHCVLVTRAGKSLEATLVWSEMTARLPLLRVQTRLSQVCEDRRGEVPGSGKRARHLCP